MAVVGDLLVQLAANTAKFSEDMGKAASTVEKAGERIRKVCTEIQEAIEGIAVVVGFEKIIEAAGSAERALQQVTAVINSTGQAAGVTAKDVKELSESLGRMTGIDDALIMSMESVLLSFNGLSRETLPRASQAVLDLSARFGMDLTAAARLVGKAMSDPVKGMAALRREIGSLTPEQQNMIKNFVKAGDVMDAQNVILDALKGHTNAAAEAARDGLTGAFKAVQASATELFAALGGGGDSGGLRYSLEIVNKLLEDATSNSNLLKAALEGLAASVATLLLLKLPEYFTKGAMALAAMSLQGKIALGLAALVGVLVTWRAETGKTGDTWDRTMKSMGETFERFINLVPQGFNFAIKSAQAFQSALSGYIGDASKQWSDATNSWGVNYVQNVGKPVKQFFGEIDTQMKKWKDDIANAGKGQNGTSGNPNDPNAAAKAAREAAREAAKRAREEEKIANALDRQSKQTISIMDSLRDQLRVEKDKVAGVDSETAAMQKQLETLNGLGAIGKAQLANAQQYVAKIQAGKKEEKDQLEVVDQIFKATSNSFTKQQQLAMAVLTGTINQKQFEEGSKRIVELKEKESQEAIKSGAEQDKIAKSLLIDQQEQLAAINNKLSGEKQLTPMMALEAKINKEISDPGLRSSVLQQMRQTQTAIDQQNAKYQAQLKVLQDIGRQNVSNAAKFKEVKQMIDQGALSIQEAKDAMAKYSESTSKAWEQVKGLGSSLSSTFANAITGGQKFSDVLKSLMKEIARMIIQLVIVDTLVNAIKSAFTFGIGGGASGAATAMSAAKAAQSGLASLQGYATGGRPPTGQPYIVGENGPEVRIDDGPGSIYTMNQIRGMTRTNGGDSGGNSTPGAVTIQVMNNNGSQVSASSTVDPNNNRNLEIAIDNAVTKATKQGGALYQFLQQNGLNMRSQPS